MEVCQDMTDLEAINMRKRQCGDGPVDNPNHKRPCQGLENFTNGNYALNQLHAYDMLYWQMKLSTDTRGHVSDFMTNGAPHCVPPPNPQNPASPQPCLRCIAGESGHINHILGL